MGMFLYFFSLSRCLSPDTIKLASPETAHSRILLSDSLTFVGVGIPILFMYQYLIFALSLKVIAPAWNGRAKCAIARTFKIKIIL